MPVEFGLEFVAVVATNFADPELKLLDVMIDEIDRVGLGVLLVDLERPEARCIANGSIPEATNFIIARALEGEELDLHLYVMAGDACSLWCGFSGGVFRAATALHRCASGSD